MSDTVYVKGDDGRLQPLNAALYEKEIDLHDQLAAHPNLLAGSQIDPDRPRRWVLVAREYGIGDGNRASRWPIDLLFLDQEGLPTLVEVKRSTDTRIRRTVVGQMMDYAANAIRYGDVNAIRRAFHRTHPNEPAVLERELDVTDVAAYWSNVSSNLEQGRVRMIFVADQIPRELRRIVEFLNEQMRPAEVLAVAVQPYADASDTQQVFVPRVIGQTEAAMQKKDDTRKAYPPATFFDALAAHPNVDAETAAHVRRIYDYAKAHAAVEVAWPSGSNGFYVESQGARLFKIADDARCWTKTAYARKMVDETDWVRLVEHAPAGLDYETMTHPQQMIAEADDPDAWTEDLLHFIDWCAEQAAGSR